MDENVRQSKRLDGLDLARLFAFIGMVAVNFSLVMGVAETGESLAHKLIYGLEGRAAASFVILAGIGLGLAFRHGVDNAQLFKRAAFLFVIGMINMLIFPADIIHYYAVYFVVAAWLLTLNNRAIWCAIFVINLAALMGLLFLNYDAGWDWTTLTYLDFWTLEGFVRNLIFNGWHPLFPWVSFLAFGIWLSRQNLAEKKSAFLLIAVGLIVYLLNQFASDALQNVAAGADINILFGTSPVPPTLLYMVAGMSAASVLIGFSLMLAPLMQYLKILHFMLPAGQQTLTLYMAHIVLGMGALEALNMLENQPVMHVWAATVLFCGIAIIFAYFWAKRFGRGPLEMLMRKICK
ncbi:DUF418 domain-containing protein [Maritalea sp. S77]|uniref:DUF418 domain-containing protein n=1 Tax=Maritalea sp. S77 TaxID=3415125 RepID=UPI003C79DEDC